MKIKDCIDALAGQGIVAGRCFGSKSKFRKLHPKHEVIFNAKLYCRLGLIARGTDLDLSVDAKKLTAAAKIAGVQIFVLHENEPRFLWEDTDPTPIDEILPHAVWSTPEVSLERKHLQKLRPIVRK